VPHKTLISPERAIAILRHYLTTGELTDLVPYPPLDDWIYWAGSPEDDASQRIDEGTNQ
jgi:hypothetical protein